MLLVRQGLRLGRLLKVGLLVFLLFLIFLMLNTGSNFSCGIFDRINDTFIKVDGRNFILDSAVGFSEQRKVVLREVEVPIKSRETGNFFNGMNAADLEEIEINPKRAFPTSSHLSSKEGHNNSGQPAFRQLEISNRILISQRNSTEHKFPWGSIENECLAVPYNIESLPKVSVIITFHDSEILSNIIETIHSLLQRTPSTLLQEIILISDNVKKEDLTEVLDQYIKGLKTGIIRMLHSHVQLGLIKARLMGIRAARAPVVVCMDSHMEVQERWLEPLIYEIHKNRKTLAAPYLDWMEFDIQADRWKITHGASSWKTYFDWNFVFGFQEMSAQSKIEQNANPTRPVNCPVTIGTVFAIDKQWFTDIGEFDDKMEAWGGENLDLPIRVWLNGGRVINVPCSHAAHYEAFNSRSYRHGWDRMINSNYKRVAEVWLDEYKRYLYYYRPDLLTLDVGNLTSRFALKKRAKYNFKWLLKNVFPELGLHDKDSFAHTGVENVHSAKCIMVIGLYNPTLTECDYSSPAKQGLYWNMEGQLRFPIHIFNSAFNGQARKYLLKTDEYVSRYRSPLNTVWFHWKGGPLIDVRNNVCLEGQGFQLSLQTCDYNVPNQLWNFKTYTQEYEDFVNSPTPTRNTHYLKQLHAVIKAAQQKDWIKVSHLVNSYTDFPASTIIPHNLLQNISKIERVQIGEG